MLSSGTETKVQNSVSLSLNLHVAPEFLPGLLFFILTSRHLFSCIINLCKFIQKVELNINIFPVLYKERLCWRT